MKFKKKITVIIVIVVIVVIVVIIVLKNDLRFGGKIWGCQGAMLVEYCPSSGCDSIA